MFANNANASIYLGRNAGVNCLDALERAKHEVKIVSPYLSPDYVKKLIRLKEKGIKIILITSDKVEENNYSDFSHRDLIKQKQIVDHESDDLRVKYMWVSGIMGLVSFLIGFIYIQLFILTAICLVAFIYGYNISIYDYKYYSLFKLRVFNSRKAIDGGRGYLIHSKIYVIDNRVAFLGSINFTHNGFVKSYESSIKINDQKSVTKISKEVDWLFGNADLEYINIEQWGKELYHEPRN